MEKGEISNGVTERVLMCGNEALAEAAIHLLQDCTDSRYIKKLTWAEEFENHRDLCLYQPTRAP